MPKKREPIEHSGAARFEYRVWGKHRKACRRLRELALEETEEHVEDCYLLVDDPSWNAKVRDNALKVKRLVAEDKGFERWAARKHRSSETAPSPFDVLFDELGLERLQHDEPYDLAEAVDGLDPELNVRAIFVMKRRHRYRVGSLRAEVTDIEISETNEVLRTLAIEGDDLDELVALRKELGLRGEQNTPVHQAIDTDNDS